MYSLTSDRAPVLCIYTYIYIYIYISEGKAGNLVHNGIMRYTLKFNGPLFVVAKQHVSTFNLLVIIATGMCISGWTVVLVPKKILD